MDQWITLPRDCRRRAFTLVELLVVMSIIVLLVALSAAGVMRHMGSQANANTVQYIRTVQSQLDRQWAAVVEFSGRQQLPAAVVNLAGGNRERARVILAKMYVKQAFPMTWVEANTPIQVNAGGQSFTLPPLGGFQSVVALPPPPPEYQSSALLLIALERNGMMKREDLGSAVGSVSGVDFIKDGWGMPIVFCRWPTGSPFINGSADAGDPNNILADATWQATWKPQFEGLLHPLPPRSGSTVAQPLVPMIASSGPDKKLGLNVANGTFSEANPPQAQDNIVNVNLPSSFREGAVYVRRPPAAAPPGFHPH